MTRGDLEFTTVWRLRGATSLATLGRCLRSKSSEFLQHTTLVCHVFCSLVDEARIIEEVLARSASRGFRNNGGRPRLDLDLLLHEI
jgi:hypothetical protein